MEKPNYFRRCHMCGAVCQHEDHGNLDRCDTCGKPWAKFRYFDDRFTPVQSDRTLRPPQLNGEWEPINGLTVYWEAF